MLREQRDLGDALDTLAGALETVELGPDAASLAAERDRLAGSIRSYLIPRTTDPAAPMTVVLAGPTGSGKSTMLNSLAGLDISKTGALRPTTRAPVVLCRSGATARYERIGGVGCEVAAGDARILDDIVLVDAPDLDSTATHHRAIAEILIDNADVVVFVTSALRYADEVPWQVLRRAVSRGTPVIHVLNRVESASAGAVVDFKSRLRRAGLDDDLIAVPEHHLSEGARQVPPTSVSALRERLGGVVANRDGFAGEVFDRVLRATVDQVTGLVHSLSAIHDDIVDVERGLKNRLADRLERFDLDGMDRHVVPTPPADDSRRAIRRWQRNTRRLDEESVQDLESGLVERIVSVIHSDLRHWLVEEGGLLKERNVDPARIIEDVVVTARSTVEGWVGFVARIAADHEPREAPLIHLVLLEASTFEGSIRPTALALGDEGTVLVERARRELVGRIHVVYENAGDLVVEAIRQRHGQLDDDNLRTSLGAVTSALAPSYA